MKEIPVPSSEAPWLVFDNYFGGNTFSTAYLDNKLYFVKDNVPKLIDKRMVSSHFGWIILLSNSEDDENVHDTSIISLWNPVTAHMINLPPLHHVYDPDTSVSFFLTSPPTNNDNDDHCFVIVIFLGFVFACRCRYDQSRDDECWFSKIFEIEGVDRAFVIDCTVLDRAVYCWVMTGALASIHVISGSHSGSDSLAIRHEPISLPHCCCFSPLWYLCYNYMVESCGSIYIVQLGLQHYNWCQDVKVWKLDLDLHIAVPVTCLGDRAFFLCNYNASSTWCVATSDDNVHELTGGIKNNTRSRSVLRNCIYIYNGNITEDNVILFNLNDRTTTYLPCPRMRLPCHPFPMWVMHRQPPRRLEYQQLGNVESKPYRYSIMQSKQEEVESNLLGDVRDDDYITRLPRDLIKIIGEYMHMFDYWNFRCTCKMIHSSTPPAVWRINDANKFPLFLVFDNDVATCRLIDPFRNNDNSRPCIFNLAREYFRVEFSKDGWLIIFDGEHRRFFNPFTGIFLNLPSLESYIAKIGFSSRPNSSDCLTVTIYSCPRTGLVLHYHRYGDHEWTKHVVDTTQNVIDFCPGDATPVYRSGAFYFLDRVGYLGVLELTNENVTWRVYDQRLAQTPKFHSSYLIDHGQELLAVVIGKMGKYVSVFSFDDCKKKWVRVKSIGNHVLFVSPYSSFSVATTDDTKMDRIYLPWLKGGHVVYYSLKTLKFHAVDGHNSSWVDFLYFKYPSRFCWI